MDLDSLLIQSHGLVQHVLHEWRSFLLHSLMRFIYYSKDYTVVVLNHVLRLRGCNTWEMMHGQLLLHSYPCNPCKYKYKHYLSVAQIHACSVP